MSVHQLAGELVSEGVQQPGDGFLHADVSLQLSAQRRHSFTFDAARHDVVEPRHVGVAVQSQTMRRDVSTTVDSNGTDLVVSDPNSSVRRRRCFKTKTAADRDHGSLQLADVPANALLEAGQVQDRVADQLSRPVEGDETSSVGAVHIGPQQAESVQQLGRVGFVADPGGVDRWVLTQQKSVSWTGPVPVHKELLQPQSLLVGDQAQADHLHHRPDALHPGLETEQEPEQEPGNQTPTLTHTLSYIRCVNGPITDTEVHHRSEVNVIDKI